MLESSFRTSEYILVASESMDRLLRLGQSGLGGLGKGAAATDAPVVDTQEQVYISSLALLKVSHIDLNNKV